MGCEVKPFDEAAGAMLDELLRVYRIKGRHRTSCDLSRELRKARAEAWDEGMRAANSIQSAGLSDNPYRKED